MRHGPLQAGSRTESTTWMTPLAQAMSCMTDSLCGSTKAFSGCWTKGDARLVASPRRMGWLHTGPVHPTGNGFEYSGARLLGTVHASRAGREGRSVLLKVVHRTRRVAAAANS